MRHCYSLNGLIRLTNDDIYKLVSNIVTFYEHNYGKKMAHGCINVQIGVTSGAVGKKWHMEVLMHR